jgi:quinohemoprotein ethanol dehydrogenase
VVANADEGLKVYEGNCLACHGKGGEDGHNGPNLKLSKVTSDAQKVIERVKKGGTTMPAFEGILTEEQINNVAAYLTDVIAKE